MRNQFVLVTTLAPVQAYAAMRIDRLQCTVAPHSPAVAESSGGIERRHNGVIQAA
jgi:hypothetical protein